MSKQSPAQKLEAVLENAKDALDFPDVAKRLTGAVALSRVQLKDAVYFQKHGTGKTFHQTFQAGGGLELTWHVEQAVIEIKDLKDCIMAPLTSVVSFAVAS